MKEVRGLLLKITWLANDDAVLDVFTDELGRISVFAGKLARSKKRQQELDFFRLLRLELEPTRTAYRLTGVSTERWYGRLAESYALSEQFFATFQHLRTVLPEAKPTPEFFALSTLLLDQFQLDQASLYLSFWEVKALQAAGVCPRFDLVRDDMWWQLESFECFAESVEHSVIVPNAVRQLLEWLRRADLLVLTKDGETIPEGLADQALVILQKVSEYH